MPGYSRKELSALRDRWIGKQALDAMRGLGKGPLSSPFGQTVDGLHDYRGLEIRDVIRGRSFDQVDFSACTRGFVGQFMECKFNACAFDNAALDTNLGRELVDCSLVEMDLSAAKLYGKFVRCDFSRAKLFGAAGTAVLFEDCIFDNANLKRAHFVHGAFVRCSATGARFGSGSLARCRIEGGNLLEQELGNTLL